jgi:cyclic pyranopterin phosphate synthase
MSDRLTHVDATGSARMVDVTAKPATARVARAGGAIRMAPATLAAIRTADTPKGDVLAVARIAGIQAAKRTGDLIPLCHPVALRDVQVVLTLDDALPGVRAEATARCVGPTGVEMEALTAVSVALLTVYDMAKALDRAMTVVELRLLEKDGGASGRWVAP